MSEDAALIERIARGIYSAEDFAHFAGHKPLWADLREERRLPYRTAARAALVIISQGRSQTP